MNREVQTRCQLHRLPHEAKWKREATCWQGPDRQKTMKGNMAVSYFSHIVICMPHLFICTYLNSSCNAFPLSSVLCVLCLHIHRPNSLAYVYLSLWLRPVFICYLCCVVSVYIFIILFCFACFIVISHPHECLPSGYLSKLNQSSICYSNLCFSQCNQHRTVTPTYHKTHNRKCSMAQYEVLRGPQLGQGP